MSHDRPLGSVMKYVDFPEAEKDFSLDIFHFWFHLRLPTTLIVINNYNLVKNKFLYVNFVI